MSDWFHLEYERVARITDDAVLFIVQGDNLWLPISQINPEDFGGLEVSEDDGSVCITNWIAGKKGLL